MCAYLTCRPLTGGQLIVPIKDLLFVTWHRPYVALFEVRGLSLELDWIIKLKSLQQVLVSHAVRIAAEYPPDLQPEYVAAAQSLRQPYWDWASDSTIPPAAYAVNVTVSPVRRDRNPQSLVRLSFPAGAGRVDFRRLPRDVPPNNQVPRRGMHAEQHHSIQQGNDLGSRGSDQ
jgi:hypothetical protein